MAQSYRGAVHVVLVSAVALIGALGLTWGITATGKPARAQDLLRLANADGAVQLAGVSFTPSTIEISAGETITWTNTGGFHNVEADDASFRSGDPTTDLFVFGHTFAVPGTYTYRCAIHAGSGMTGTVIVTGETLQPKLYLPVLARAEGA